MDTDFKGAAKRLTDIDIPRIGHRIGVGEDELHAFMEVEAANSGFDSQGRPKMLFEPHVFYRNLTGKKREEAIRQGLAYQRWGEKAYPRDSYPRLKKAMAIDATAALKAASWGRGQILGENHAMVGYATPQAMVKAFMEDEAAHLEAIVDFLIAAGIDDDLREHRWEVVARVYNGPGYKKHNYHGRMEAAFKKWQRIPDTPWSPDGSVAPTPETPAPSTYPVLRVGAQGFMVRHLQERLAALGYGVGEIDGKFGPATRAGVLAFQADNNLKTDGVMGPVSWQELETVSRPRPIVEDRQTATVADLREKGSRTVKQGDIAQIGGAVATGLGGIAAAQKTLEEVSAFNDALGGVLTALEPIVAFASQNWWIAVAGLGLAALMVGKNIKEARLDDHRSGKNLGR